MTGKVLNNRYELVEKIGYGGMAEVFKARCRVLKRWVAVKILKDEFVNDEEFLERFEREAYAAGSLNHPNIVSIYDVGREENIHYIVMEYIDGITLKDYIQQNGALPWEEAADIAMSILSALHKAHRHGIIHRDIKPQNILMTSDNVPKVADFGIARASSTATVTRKVDTVGSVHYASPEQARGGYTDEKSDLYSVGVTLFEMVTGRVPFNADNPVTVALKQIEDQPPKASAYVPDLPPTIDHIILRAMKKAKADRYDSALQMIAELDHLRKGEAMGDDRIQTDPFATKVIGSLEEEDLAGKAVRGKNKKTKKKKEKMSGAKRFGVTMAYIVLIGVIFGGLYLAYDSLVKPIVDIFIEPKTPSVELKNYVGMHVDEAMTDILELNLPYEDPTYEYSDTVEKGIIISQRPVAGMPIMPLPGGMTKVELTISSGKKEVEIPKNIKFKDYLDVVFLLRDELGLRPIETPKFSDEVAQGMVIETDPPMGSIVIAGSEVRVFKSLGPELKDVIVPNLIGDTLDEARHKLLSQDLSMGKIFPEGREGYRGVIIKQEPGPGETVKEWTQVNLYFQDEQEARGGDGSGSHITLPGEVRVTEWIHLPQGVSYGDTIEMFAYTIFESTGEEILQFSGVVQRSEFPRAITVPIIDGSKTILKVYLDNVLQYQKEVFRE